MAAGRKTGGRTKGVKNKKSLARLAIIAASGLAPLEYMLKVMRDEHADEKRRDEMAKAAAPFVHPRLAAIEHSGSIARADDMSDDELAAIARGGSPQITAQANGQAKPH